MKSGLGRMAGKLGKSGYRVAFALLVSWCGSVPALHAQDECKKVLDVVERLATTPHHAYMTQVNGQKQESREEISVDGTIYVQINGKWKKSPMTVQDLLKQQRENRANAKNTSCRHLRDEAVNGEAAEVYSAHSENQVGTSDSVLWVSKSKNQILRQEEDIGGTGAKLHESVRYEYTNVTAPPVAQ